MYQAFEHGLPLSQIQTPIAMHPLNQTKWHVFVCLSVCCCLNNAEQTAEIISELERSSVQSSDE